MDILNRLKEKYYQALVKKYRKKITRRQFNMMISSEIVKGVNLLAIFMHVPCYVMTEHLLQVGISQVANNIDDVEKMNILKEHLVKAHLVGNR